jgi:hypothetical protein
MVMRINPRLPMPAPLAWELEPVKGRLRAIPDFLGDHVVEGGSFGFR